MKKYLVFAAALMTSIVFTSCKSNESAYKKAYEKAKAEQQTNTSTVTTPVQQTTPVAVAPVTNDYSNVSVRTEDVTLVDGAGLKAYSVVVGSFSIQANASALQAKLKGQGYQAQIAKNPTNNMFRVIATTFADKASAAQSRESLRATYADAWLLYQK